MAWPECCKTCLAYNGDMCELISHECTDGDMWRPSTEFIEEHNEVLALVAFAELMRSWLTEAKAETARLRDELERVRVELAGAVSRLHQYHAHVDRAVNAAEESAHKWKNNHLSCWDELPGVIKAAVYRALATNQTKETDHA